jgi:hypothetical protein
MLIFVLAALAAVDVARGAVRATKDSRQVTLANWLLQNSIVELETRLETEGMDKGCEKKKEGKFKEPYEKYRWIQYCDEIDLKLSQTAAMAMRPKQEGSDDRNDNKEDLVLKMVLDTASDYITKSLRELHTEVLWTEGKQQKKVSATTHFVRYDQPIALPGVSGGSGQPSTPSTPSTPGTKTQ